MSLLTIRPFYLAPFRGVSSNRSNSDVFSSLFDELADSFNYGRIAADETEDAIVLTLPLPGFKKDDVNIEVDHQAHLTVSAKRGTHQVSRTVTLGDQVDTEAVSAKLEDGLLSITVPKKAQAKPRKIAVA